MNKINIMICDDHQIFIDGLKAGLEDADNICIAATSNNGENVMDQLDQRAIDVILMDVELPNRNGVELTSMIASKHPAIKVIMLTMHDDHKIIDQAVKAGARGYLIKNTTIAEIEEAIKTVYNDHPYFKGGVLNKIIEFSNDPKDANNLIQLLTERELQILVLIAKGKSNQEFAESLFISIHTVHSHRKNIIKKLGVNNTAELISFAYQNQLISINDSK